MFQQWTQLVGSKLQKQANTTFIATHHRDSLQVGLCVLFMIFVCNLCMLPVGL